MGYSKEDREMAAMILSACACNVWAYVLAASFEFEASAESRCLAYDALRKAFGKKGALTRHYALAESLIRTGWLPS